MSHKEQIDFCERVKKRFPNDFVGQNVLDVGSLDINGNNRYLFSDCDYTGIDLGPGKNVDIVCSAHEHIGQYDTIISTEAFEHDKNIKESLNNIVKNLLKPGGLFLFTCAGDGRHEHGTGKTTPEDSPFTNEYYKNLSEKIVKDLIDIDSVFGNDFKFSYNSRTKDLYFVGVKITQAKSPQFLESKKVSIIIPVIRPDKVELCISAIVKNSGTKMEQYEIIHEVDTDGIGCPAMVAKLVEKTKYDYVMFLGDDTEPQKDFLKNALDEMSLFPQEWGVVGLNTQDDRSPVGNPYAHWLAHKNMLEFIEGGDFFPTDYKHCWCDSELYDIANDLDRWCYAEKSYIKHNHHVNGTNEWDEGYKKAYSEENQIHDKETYIKRKINRMRASGGKLGIGFPLTYDYLHKAFFETYSMLDKPVHVQLMPKIHGHIDVVRNDIVDQALMLGCTYLLFMDTDQVYRSLDMIPNMLERMQSDDLKFLSAKVHRRYPPFDPILLKGEIGKFELISEELTDSGDVIEIDATGTGCVMIDTRVFLEMKNPWFELRKSETGKDVGEDISFCAKLKEMGHSLFCDTSFEIGHLTMMETNGDTNKLFRKLNDMEAPK